MDYLASLSQETWQKLALNVAWSNVIFGLIAIIFPRPAARFFYLPYSAPVSKQAGDVEMLIPLLGCRDISIGGGMILMAQRGHWEAVGLLIVACSLFCLADTFTTLRRKGPVW